MYIIAGNTVACVFVGTVFAFIGFYVGASRTLQPTSPSLFFVFTQIGSPFVPVSPNKLAMEGVGHSPGKQSVSLGRSTVVGVDGGPGLGGGKGVGGSGGGGGANGTGSGSGSVPWQNSLHDLKIPVRISQEQVGL